MSPLSHYHNLTITLIIIRLHLFLAAILKPIFQLFFALFCKLFELWVRCDIKVIIMPWNYNTILTSVTKCWRQVPSIFAEVEFKCNLWWLIQKRKKSSNFYKNFKLKSQNTKASQSQKCRSQSSWVARSTNQCRLRSWLVNFRAWYIFSCKGYFGFV